MTGVCKAKNRNTLECSDCLEEICSCDGCKEYFMEGDDVYCSEDGKHLCNLCTPIANYDNKVEFDAKESGSI